MWRRESPKILLNTNDIDVLSDGKGSRKAWSVLVFIEDGGPRGSSGLQRKDDVGSARDGCSCGDRWSSTL